MNTLTNLLQNDPATFLLLVGAVISLALLYTISVFVNFAPSTVAAQYYTVRKRSLVILSFVLAILILVVSAMVVLLGPVGLAESIVLI